MAAAADDADDISVVAAASAAASDVAASRADDDGEVADDSAPGELEVELGFVQAVEGDIPVDLASPSEWDGGKIGGKPHWIVPGAALPLLATLTCRRCERPLVLLAQVYAPLDEVDVGHTAAFHRMLMVFACTSERCVNRSSACEVAIGQPNVVAVRAQRPESVASPAAAAGDDGAPATTCAICGLPAPFRCAGCGHRWYCSPWHQQVHWKLGGGLDHKSECKTAAAAASSSPATSPMWDRRMNAAAVDHGAVFPQYELVVESEPTAAARARHAVKSLPANAAAALAAHRAAEAAAGAAGGSGAAARAGAGAGEGMSLSGLSQHKLARLTGASLQADVYTAYFQRRTAAEPAQMVRYCRWPMARDPGDDGLAGNELLHRAQQRRDAAAARAAARDAAKRAAKAAAAAAAAPASRGGGDGDEEEEEADRRGDAASEASSDAGDDDGADDDDDASNEADIAVADVRAGAPLWLHRRDVLEDAAAGGRGVPPPCERCGAPRAFEMQLMPQLIDRLHVSHSHSVTECKIKGCAPVAAEFGTIAIYTCTRSCGGAGYAPEFVWVQPTDELEAREPIGEAGAGAAAGGATAAREGGGT